MTTTMGTLPMRLINFEVERLIISNLLSSPDFCKAVLPQLTPEDFTLEVHQRVFSAITSTAKGGYDLGVAGVYRWLFDVGFTRSTVFCQASSLRTGRPRSSGLLPAPWIKSSKKRDSR